MSDQLTNNSAALRLFFTDDIYLLKEDVYSPEDTIPMPAVPIPTTTVDAKEVEIVPPRTDEVNFTFLGKNLRNILILVHDADNQVSTEPGRELLRNIVKAIGLTANDFALLNYATYPNTSFAQFKKSLNSTTLFAFGVTPQQLGLPDVAPHAVSEYESVNMIFSTNLHQLSSDQQGKKMLWGSLKQMNL
ncbi:hypothetical protein [Pedobacter duraquae]|nr:hypothetical protein [Pedobacter duraquae]